MSLEWGWRVRGGGGYVTVLPPWGGGQDLNVCNPGGAGVLGRRGVPSISPPMRTSVRGVPSSNSSMCTGVCSWGGGSSGISGGSWYSTSTGGGGFHVL